MDKRLEKAFNDQINAELYSEYLYLAMKTYFKKANLLGFANWFDVQVQEEHAHGMGMYEYVLERGGDIEFKAIEKPEMKANDILGIMEEVLNHEKWVTSNINALTDVAEEVKDRAAISFLDWYIKEQVEEEANVSKLITTLKLIGDDKHALLMLDKELATRVFNPPVIG
ncbi:ferritin [bacterium]|nr:ferritin [bacterium]